MNATTAQQREKIRNLLSKANQTYHKLTLKNGIFEIFILKNYHYLAVNLPINEILKTALPDAHIIDGSRRECYDHQSIKFTHPK